MTAEPWPRPIPRGPERGYRPAPVAERLARRSRVGPNGCLEWTGHRAHWGYGQIDIAGRNQPTHRVAWELVHGPIPDGLLVLHRCDNPPCMNVEHLFLGTQSDNLRDMYAKGRAAPAQLGQPRARLTHCRRGGHELTPENVLLQNRGRTVDRMCRTCERARRNRAYAALTARGRHA